MVGRRGEAPLVPPYRLHSPNKAMALTIRASTRSEPTEELRRASQPMTASYFEANSLANFGECFSVW